MSSNDDTVASGCAQGAQDVRARLRTGRGLGGPHLLALVSEVASRALQVVWRQKYAHRRLRPEVYGGLLHVQEIGVNNAKRAYGLPTWPFDGFLPRTKKVITDSKYFLPLAFTAGSPAHPAYGAGHATVADACVTILKAFYDDTQTCEKLLEAAASPGIPRPTSRTVRNSRSGTPARSTPSTRTVLRPTSSPTAS